MTKASKNTKTNGGKRKPKQTAHRVAASNREVRKHIAQLRKQWSDANAEERRTNVADLLGRGCSIRGLADDIDQPESVIRYYSKPAPESPKKEKPKTLEAPIPVKAASKQIAAAPANGTQRLAPPKDQLGVTRQQAAPAGKRPSIILPPCPTELRREALPDDPPTEKEESLESLRLRLPQIIIEFIRAKLGTPDRPATSTQIQVLLGSLRTHSKLQPPSIYPRHLPNSITMSQLYELTGVNFRNKQLDAVALGEWLAVLVLSLDPRAHPDPRSSPWEPEIKLAEQQLVPQPEQRNTPLLDSRPQFRPPSARITTTGFADRNTWRVTSRTRGF